MPGEGVGVGNDRKMTYCISLKMVNTVTRLVRRKAEDSKNKPQKLSRVYYRFLNMHVKSRKFCWTPE